MAPGRSACSRQWLQTLEEVMPRLFGTVKTLETYAVTLVQSANIARYRRRD